MLLPVAVILAVAISFCGTKKSPPEKPTNAIASVHSATMTQMPSDAPPASMPSSTAAPTLPDAPTTGLIAVLFDESLPLKSRCDAARALARVGNQTAMTSLKNALAANSPPYLKAAIATALGECPNPAARSLLNDLSHGSDEITARGAVRGLALRGDPDGMNSLGALLFNPQTPMSVRTEAALSLGDVNLPGSGALLVRAAAEIQDETVVENVLAGLAKRPFAETQFFFNNYLGSADVPVESKIAALEALGNASGDVTPFLLNYLNNPNAEVRSAVVWSLITAGNESDISPQLVGALRQEPEPAVRARLYQALENQSSTNAMDLLPFIQNESDPTSRLAGLDFLAGSLRAATAPEVLTFFNQTAVPELQSNALNSDNSQARLASVLALNRAGTPEAIAALKVIVQKSTDQKVISAVRLP